MTEETVSIELTKRQVFVLRAVLVHASSNVAAVNKALADPDGIEVGGDTGQPLDADEIDDVVEEFHTAYGNMGDEDEDDDDEEDDDT